MTTAPDRPAATVSDVTHPDWCELTTCEPTHGVLDLPGDGTHHSLGTMWPSHADGCENTVRLVHSDNWAKDGRNHGTTHVQLIIRQTEIENPDGSAMRADTWLQVDDARMLAAALTRYAELAERDNYGRGAQIRYPAAEIRSADDQSRLPRLRGALERHADEHKAEHGERNPGNVPTGGDRQAQADDDEGDPDEEVRALHVESSGLVGAHGLALLRRGRRPSTLSTWAPGSGPHPGPETGERMTHLLLPLRAPPSARPTPGRARSTSAQVSRDGTPARPREAP